MALNLFTQKDIERIDINDIPEEFINYFDDLNSIEKQRISELRPDLVKALGYKQEEPHVIEESEDKTEVEFIPHEENSILSGQTLSRRTELSSRGK